MANNRICKVCGASYSYCPVCYRDRSKEEWHVLFDNTNCKDIFDICTKFNMKLIDKKTASRSLKKLDISNIANDQIVVDIDNILGEVAEEFKVDVKPVAEE